MDNSKTPPARATSEADLPRKRLKLDPDLADGCHWTVADDASQVMESLQLWMDEAEAGESVTISIKMMSDREVRELPSI